MKWQALAVLHIVGEEVDPSWLVKRYRLEGATVWQKGEPDAHRKPRLLSGLKVTLGNVNSASALRSALLRSLKTQAALYAEVARSSGHAAIDIGLMVPPNVPRTVTFDGDLLSKLLAAGVGLHVTDSPCAEEEVAK